MKQHLKNILRDTDTHAALVLSVVAALLWQVYSPRLSHDATHFSLGPGGRELAEPLQKVEEFYYERVGGKTPSNAVFEMGGTISLPRSGYYTLKGAIAHSIPGPLRLDVNDQTVTHAALFGLAGQGGGDVDTYVLARNLRLNAGTNRISITGNNLGNKAIIITARHQARPSALRFAGRAVLLFSIAVALIAALRLSTRSPRSRLIAVLLLTAAATGLPIAILYGLRGERLADLGVIAPNLETGLQALENRLKTDRPEPQSSELSVCIFGDSTHFARAATMVAEFRSHLSDQGDHAVDVYGLAHPALGLREYYLLANRVVSERPDVLIVPVNILTFQESWLTNPRWEFPILERYLKPREIPKVLPYRVGNRTFKWEHILLKNLDFAWLDSKAEHFIGGVRRYRGLEEMRFSVGMEKRLSGSPSGRNLPDAPAPGLDGPFIVDSDHQLFPLADALNALCKKYGVHVLYYSVPIHPYSKNKFGARENYALIRDRLSGSSHVTFLELSRDFPASAFRDLIVHLKPEGLSLAAERLTEKVRRIQARQDSASATAASQR